MPTCEKSPSEDGNSVLNTTQDSSLTEDSCAKKSDKDILTFGMSANSLTENSIGEINQQDAELEIVWARRGLQTKMFNSGINKGVDISKLSES